jgi:hypothetical protein
MTILRFGSAGLALCLLLPAIVLFHRFSPDKVKQSHARKRRSPLEIVNGWTRPLAKQVQPLLIWSAKSANFFGQIVADLALTFVNAPFAIIALIAFTVFATLLNLQALPGLTIFVVAFWGVLISDISTRDFQAAIEGMTTAVKGGAVRRYFRQLMATMIMGFLFAAVIIFRLSFSSPLFAFALVVGIIGVSALATSFGKISNTSKTFMSLYLFALYVATQVPHASMLDFFGFNRVATVSDIFVHAIIALSATFLGCLHTMWKSR